MEEGRRHQTAYNGDHQGQEAALIEAAVAYHRAEALYGALNEREAEAEAKAAIYWCKKQMNLAVLQRYLDRLAREQGKAPRPATEPAPEDQAFAKAEAQAAGLRDDPQARIALWEGLAQAYPDTAVARQAAARADEARRDRQARLQAGTMTITSRLQRLPTRTGTVPHPPEAEIKRGQDDLKKAIGTAWNQRAAADRRRLIQRLSDEIDRRSQDAGAVMAASREMLRHAQELEDYGRIILVLDDLAGRFQGVDVRALGRSTFKALAAKPTCLAFQTLLQDPRDAAANTVVGRYYAVVAQQWSEALPYLAAGQDADLKAAAMEDLKEPIDDAGRLAVAEGWHQIARKRIDAKEVRIACWQRARVWYRQVTATSGDLRARCDAALAEIDKALPPPPSTP